MSAIFRCPVEIIYSVASVAALRSSKPTNVLGISSLYSQQFTNGIVLFNEHKMSFSNWLRVIIPMALVDSIKESREGRERLLIIPT